MPNNHEPRSPNSRGSIRWVTSRKASSGPPGNTQEILGSAHRNRKHWWDEIKGWLKQIKENGQSSEQPLRDLLKKFSQQQLDEILEALQKAAEMMGEEPPDFPPLP
jgi:hypothetical protein